MPDGRRDERRQFSEGAVPSGPAPGEIAIAERAASAAGGDAASAASRRAVAARESARSRSVAPRDAYGLCGVRSSAFSRVAVPGTPSYWY